MVLGRIRVSGFDHSLGHRRQLSRQPATDHCRSLDLRFVVLDPNASAAAAGAPSPLSVLQAVQPSIKFHSRSKLGSSANWAAIRLAAFGVSSSRADPARSSSK
jgi:hypothetical protein